MKSPEVARQPKLRVLVVDDEQGNLDAFRRVFRRHFELTLALSANDALRRAAEENFDVVITDYAMPGRNGVDLLTELASEQPDAARLLLTAQADLPEVNAAKAAGTAHGVLMKPWEEETVRHWVTNYHRLMMLRRAVHVMSTTAE